ncbi:Cyclin N-terminal domain-containing protein [Mycena kentingensis (nom. inval.)]|nr:Cyclin N-terminal domain-containing protein [Mycena kentingensis (nom. inval.)]
MAAPSTRVPLRPRPLQRSKADENATSRHVRQLSGNAAPSRFVPKELLAGKSRPVLSEVTVNSRKEPVGKLGAGTDKPETTLKRLRSDSSALPPQRVPLGPGRVQTSIPVATTMAGPARVPLARPLRSATSSRRPLRVVPSRPTADDLLDEQLRDHEEPEEEEMNVDEDEGVQLQEDLSDSEPEPEPMAVSEADAIDQLEEDEIEEEENATVAARVPRIWPDISPERALQYQKEVQAIRDAFHDDVDIYDTTMVSEYADEIFDYMNELEETMMPGADYMDHQNEITWTMRQTLVDWLLQVHLRYHMLPETLWIAVNIVDRFLTHRTVSLVKLQLVGVTAMFIAAKYEEILAPSVEEFVYMTENGYNKEEILKGERIMLQTLEFRISHYCSPYSWMRKISKADDYDIQTRTLSKFLTEVTLLDYRFVRVKPSLIAAVGMYCARRMLAGDWNESFVFYSGYTEAELLPGHEMLVEKLAERNFSRQYVCKKYSHKKFLKASMFAIDWAKAQVAGNGDAVERMMLEE